MPTGLPGRVLYYDALTSKDKDKVRPRPREQQALQLRIPLKNSFQLPVNKDDANLDDDAGVSPQRLYGALRGQFAAAYLQQKLQICPNAGVVELVVNNLPLRPSNCLAQVSKPSRGGMGPRAGAARPSAFCSPPLNCLLPFACLSSPPFNFTRCSAEAAGRPDG